MSLIKSLSKLLVSIMILVAGLIVSYLSLQMPMMKGAEVGPGLLPSFLAASISLCALIEVTIEFRNIRTEIDQDPASANDVKANSTRAWAIIFSFAAYVIILKWFGLALSTFIFTSFIIVLLKRLPWYKVLAFSFIISACTFLLFTLVFDLGLPAGPFSR